jgi:hypothetical protein
MKFKYSMVASVLLASCFSVSSEPLTQVTKAADKINQSALQSQAKIDKIADTMQGRLQQFKSLNKEIDGLKVYNEQLEQQLADQVSEMAELNQSIDQVSLIERQITPLMLRMVASLEQFIALDVPFLPKERAERVEKLKAMMAQASVESSEKFRRVLEAYQIEVDYGRTIEAYTGLLDVEGAEREVEFLRIGRLNLMYLTKDGNFAGIWDQQNKRFESLGQEHVSQLSKALRIAKKQLAPDLLTLPVYAAKG